VKPSAIDFTGIRAYARQSNGLAVLRALLRIKTAFGLFFYKYFW